MPHRWRTTRSVATRFRDCRPRSARRGERRRGDGCGYPVYRAAVADQCADCSSPGRAMASITSSNRGGTEPDFVDCSTRSSPSRTPASDNVRCVGRRSPPIIDNVHRCGFADGASSSSARRAIARRANCQHGSYVCQRFRNQVCDGHTCGQAYVELGVTTQHRDAHQVGLADEPLVCGRRGAAGRSLDTLGQRSSFPRSYGYDGRLAPVVHNRRPVRPARNAQHAGARKRGSVRWLSPRRALSA